MLSRNKFFTSITAMIVILSALNVAVAAEKLSVTFIQYDSPGMLEFDRTMWRQSRDSDLLLDWVRSGKIRPSVALIDEAMKASTNGDNFAAAVIASQLLKSIDEDQKQVARKLVLSMIESKSSIALIMRGDQKVENLWSDAKQCDAVSDYELARRLDNPIATTKLGLLRINGRCLPKNTEQGMQYFLEASRLGEPVSEGLLGAMMILRGDDESVTKGVEFLERAVTHGNNVAALDLAKHYIGSKNKTHGERIVDLLVRAIDANLPDAPRLLAKYLYLSSSNLEEETLKRGANALVQLDESGSSETLYGVGVVYFDGLGLERDPERAFDLFQQAYQLGHVDAGHRMIQMYHQGDGVEQNRCKALEVARALSQQGDSAAAKYVETYGDHAQ